MNSSYVEFFVDHRSSMIKLTYADGNHVVNVMEDYIAYKKLKKKLKNTYSGYVLIYVVLR